MVYSGVANVDCLFFFKLRHVCSQINELPPSYEVYVVTRSWNTAQVERLVCGDTEINPNELHEFLLVFLSYMHKIEELAANSASSRI